ncbi:HIT family protein [Candidatus Izemoplasma sp. B36]|uniref:HIT family protein n=1 Tax=Candidatus Izemoplasma sp. B36 TaxID=3242468 RepID=UPI00355871C9
MNNCIFCKIVNGEVPSYKIYEDENVMAILDISQATKGHTLVLSKKHYKNLYDIDEKLAGDIFRVVPKIANAIKDAFNPIGLNVLVNTEKPLQAVFHFHLHIIPRYYLDGVDIDFINNQGNTSKAEYEEIKEKIIKELK